MVVVHGGLARRTQERNGGFARRHHVAKEEIGQRRAAHGSGMETVQQGVAVGKVALDGKRTAGHHHGHHRFAGASQRLQQFALGALEVQVGQGMGLAGEDGFFTHEGQHNIGVTGGGKDIVKAFALLTAEPQAGDIGHLTREPCLQGLQRGNRMFLFAVEGPGAQLVVRGIGQGTGHQHAHTGLEGQHACVLEQNGAFLGRLLCGSEVLRRVLHGAARRHIHVRMLEQAQHHLYAEDVPDSLVDGLLPHGAFLHQFLQVGQETIGHHVHVHAGLDGFLGHVFAVLAKTVGDHLAHGVPVGDHQAVEAPLTAEDVLHHEGVAGGRHAVVVVEGGHEGERTGFYRGLERRQVHVPELALGKVGAVVVTAAFGCTVTHKVLDAGRHGRGVRQVALVAAHHGFAHAGVQVGVFAAAFRYPAPTGVAGNVQHGREGPADALRRGLDGRNAGALLHQFRVKGGCQTQRNGEQGVETMNHVPAHQQRNAQAGFLHGQPLVFVNLFRIHLVEDGTNLTGTKGICILGHVATGRNLVHLADFLLQGHLAQQFIYASLHLGSRARGSARLPGAGKHCHQTQEKDFSSFHSVQSFWNTRT